MTTVYDALCVGYERGTKISRADMFKLLVDAICMGVDEGVFRIEHKLHLRCELTGSDLVDTVTPQLSNPLVLALWSTQVDEYLSLQRSNPQERTTSMSNETSAPTKSPKAPKTPVEKHRGLTAGTSGEAADPGHGARAAHWVGHGSSWILILGPCPANLRVAIRAATRTFGYAATPLP